MVGGGRPLLPEISAQIDPQPVCSCQLCRRFCWCAVACVAQIWSWNVLTWSGGCTCSLRTEQNVSRSCWCSSTQQSHSRQCLQAKMRCTPCRLAVAIFTPRHVEYQLMTHAALIKLNVCVKVPLSTSSLLFYPFSSPFPFLPSTFPPFFFLSLSPSPEVSK